MMTNLEIIKYLATNNPARLAIFLNKICYDAWDFAKMHRTRPITDWNQWLQADPYTSCEFNSKELEEWSKAINKPIRNCLNCAHLGDPIIWCDACDDFEYWEEEK